MAQEPIFAIASTIWVGVRGKYCALPIATNHVADPSIGTADPGIYSRLVWKTTSLPPAGYTHLQGTVFVIVKQGTTTISHAGVFDALHVSSTQHVFLDNLSIVGIWLVAKRRGQFLEVAVARDVLERFRSLHAFFESHSDDRYRGIICWNDWIWVESNVGKVFRFYQVATISIVLASCSQSLLPIVILRGPASSIIQPWSKQGYVILRVPYPLLHFYGG
mmetsp:Transcript_9155/g.19019  ORF Transcript_9155/g.19019 Transcript_9155/m.19019 type:complete len:219 (-) Transcript_9155:117-773(-)